MLAEVGNFALVLAFCIAVLQVMVSFMGLQQNSLRLMNATSWLTWGQLGFLAVSYALLTQAFLTNDFSVAYVAQNSNMNLPAMYKVTGVWGGHEGSLLLWVLLLAAWSAAVATFSRSLPREMLVKVLGVLGLVSIGFLAFTVFYSNPFERLLQIPLDGADLNPLLQDPGMIVHPPLLYMGYVGMSVVFAFAMAALLSGRLDAAWARWSRPWTIVAWVFMTLGIGLGSWWAYYELGWGGWWFWDPVENASFMPWLTATALLHSLAVTEKRGGFKVWTIMLAIVTFALVVLGAFIVRSGVITSVHAFASDPERGVFLLSMLAITLLGSLAVYAWRAPTVGLGGGFSFYSKESLLLANNVLLVVATAAVFIGTLYPLLLDSMNFGLISVGPPYFDAVFTPLMLPLLFLIGAGVVVSWKECSIRKTWLELRWMLLLSLVLGGLWPLTMGTWKPLTAVGLMLVLWIVLTAAKDFYFNLKPRGRQTVADRFKRLKMGFVGMHMAHVGLALVVLAIAMVNSYEVERDVRMAPGISQSIGAYEFTLLRVERIRGANYWADQGVVEVTYKGKLLENLTPQLRYYDSRPEMPMFQASLNRSLMRDIYVSMGDKIGGDAWTMRLYYKPYMLWMWLGGILMALGGVLAATDRRYRAKRKKPVELKSGVGNET